MFEFSDLFIYLSVNKQSEFDKMFVFFFFVFFFFRVCLVSPMFSDLWLNGLLFEKLYVELIVFLYILKQIPNGPN